MIYKKDIIYIIYWVTHLTDGVTVDIIWLQLTRMSWFHNRLGLLRKEKSTSYICSIYLISYIHKVYILLEYFLSYILHIYRRSKMCVI